MTQPPVPRKFLVIDDNADSRTLLTRTLLRKYPEGVAVECQNGDTAFALVRVERLTAIVVHRTFDCDGPTMIRQLRQLDPDVPIVMVSGSDQHRIAQAAGADAFMDYGAWLTIGNVVADVIGARAKQRAKSKAKTPTEPEAV